MSRRRPTVEYLGSNAPSRFGNHGTWFLVNGPAKQVLVFYNQALHETYLHIFPRDFRVVKDTIDGCPIIKNNQAPCEGPMDFMVAQARALEIVAGERSEPEQ